MFEYQVEKVPMARLGEVLGARGNEGWRLAGMFPTFPMDVTVVLERQKSVTAKLVTKGKEVRTK